MSAAVFDVIIAGDMTRPGDQGFRIAEEIRHYASADRKVGVLQAGLPQPGRRIAPEVQSCVRRGLATVVAPTHELSTELLLVHVPSTLAWTERPLGRIQSRQTIIVCHVPEDFAVPRIRQRLRGSAELVWAPTNPWLREVAPPSLPLTAENWLPMLKASAGVSRAHSKHAERGIGWIVPSTTAGAPPPATDGVNLICLDLSRELDFSLDRITRFDGLAYFPEPGNELPDTLIRAALLYGVSVALPHWLEPHYGRGPRYCEAHEALDKLVLARRGTLSSQRRPLAAKKAGSEASQRRPVMFVAANGVGIGHMSRLLAIARRMDRRTPLLFATQAQAVGAIERLGYLAEYLPSSTYVGGDFDAWDAWFRYDLERLADAYDPALVVYDGNNPSPGLIKAVAQRRDCRLAWMRRGLWGDLTSPHIDNARWFDLIVEPGELEGQSDEGITARRRDEALLVPPIRLLDHSELLSRSDAAQALGLDPARPAALIQLGAGYNRDVVSLLDHLIGVLKQVPHLQICIAEWVNGAQSLNYWPDVTYLRGYPLSQYFKAFDFSVSAAGYNTFHEVMNFDLPTIFIPNRHPSMDDQAGRAEHAQALQAAFELDEADLGDLPDLVAIMMDAKARSFLVSSSQKLHHPNGAEAAARALTELMETVQ